MTASPEEPLDGTDQEILDQLAALYGRLDPPPADLDERVRFTIALDNLDVEVARLSAESLVGTGARGEDERTRTVTFDSDSRTIMISITESGPGLVRIDGWLAPPAPLRVELRRGAGTSTTRADDQGRFVFDDVERGLAQLLVLRDDGAGTVVTPSMML